MSSSTTHSHGVTGDASKVSDFVVTCYVKVSDGFQKVVCEAMSGEKLCELTLGLVALSPPLTLDGAFGPLVAEALHEQQPGMSSRIVLVSADGKMIWEEPRPLEAFLSKWNLEGNYDADRQFLNLYNKDLPLRVAHEFPDVLGAGKVKWVHARSAFDEIDIETARNLVCALQLDTCIVDSLDLRNCGWRDAEVITTLVDGLTKYDVNPTELEINRKGITYADQPGWLKECDGW